MDDATGEVVVGSFRGPTAVLTALTNTEVDSLPLVEAILLLEEALPGLLCGSDEREL